MNASHNSVDLEQMFPRGINSYLAGGDDLRLGVVVGGSLSKGLVVKLDRARRLKNWLSGAMWWYMARQPLLLHVDRHCAGQHQPGHPEQPAGIMTTRS